jgi:F0F1-type ATP synthase membrane subunit c/vacuolar-type H+-ATPase subunit K
MKKENGQIVESAVEARGARPGRPVLVVLGVSLVAVIVLFALVFAKEVKF